MVIRRIQLGDEVKDRITAFQGIVVSITDHLTGCETVAVQRRDLYEGKMVGVAFFDPDRLLLVSRGKLMDESPNARPLPAHQPLTGGDSGAVPPA